MGKSRLPNFCAYFVCLLPDKVEFGLSRLHLIQAVSADPFENLYKPKLTIVIL